MRCSHEDSYTLYWAVRAQLEEHTRKGEILKRKHCFKNVQYLENVHRPYVEFVPDSAGLSSSFDRFLISDAPDPKDPRSKGQKPALPSIRKTQRNAIS